MNALRVATQNLWGARAPAKERMEALARVASEQGVDVLAVQEVAGHGSSTTAHVVAEELGGVASLGEGWKSGFGLGVISRDGPLAVRETPLLSARSGQARRLLSVQLTQDVWIHVAHLDYRRADGLWREHQVVAIHRAIASIAPNSVHILCGDMNADPSADEMRFLRGETTLSGERAFYQDAWMRHHPTEPGFTWCQESGEARDARSIDVDRRLDYIYVSERIKDGRCTIASCSLLSWREHDGALVSDHAGVVADVFVS